MSFWIGEEYYVKQIRLKRHFLIGVEVKADKVGPFM